ncbi:MAG: hypothetical protein WA190_05105 [Usitatibacter sp.]
MRKVSGLLASSFVLAAGNAFAVCHWEWLCNGEGGCAQMPVCETLYEVPPPRPESAPPVPPPASLRPQKIPASLGAADCDFVMRQDNTGQWHWDQACYCSDITKARDTGTPMSNIVRCEAPAKR